MYIRYELVNEEPVRIADDSHSQMGQTSTLHYITGSSIRGTVIEKLIDSGDFDAVKKGVLSDATAFSDACPCVDGEALLPAFKGFYEDKTRADVKAVENVVVNGQFEEGHKRSYLGDFVRVDGDAIHGYNVPTGSDLKIRIGENMFRIEYIRAGIHFAGTISGREELLKKILPLIGEGTCLWIGGGRSAGLGKCRVLKAELTEDIPYSSYADISDQQGDAYMLLLSDTVMRDENGEYCGLDMAALGQKLGVTNLETAYAATSVKTVCGYNRTWHTQVPDVTMYEKGSVFHLTFDGTLTAAAKEKLTQSGIGVRRNEGFGRVLFIRDYEKVTKKHTPQTITEDHAANTGRTDEDDAVIRLAAKRYYRMLLQKAARKYIVENPLQTGKNRSSRVGVVEQILESYRYDYEKTRTVLDRYFSHDSEKQENMNRHQTRDRRDTKVKEAVDHVFDNSLSDILGLRSHGTIMGIRASELLSREEEGQMKIALLIAQMKYRNKEADV